MKSKKANQLWLLGAVSMSLFMAIVISCGSGEQKSGNMEGQRIEWTRVGIGGGGANFSPEISPHDYKVALVTCDMGGSYVTHNGGESWKMFNFGGRARFFAFDPVDPNVVYAQSSRLLKSTDKGLTWDVFYPKASGNDQTGGARNMMRQSSRYSFVLKPSYRIAQIPLTSGRFRAKCLPEPYKNAAK